MKLEALLKQAQPGMPMDQAMMGMGPDMMGGGAMPPAPPPDMSAQPLPPGPPAAPTPEELMMVMGQPPADMLAPPATDNSQIIEKQVEVIDGLAQTVQKLVDINIATGSAPVDTADNVAAAIVGSGLLDGMPTESLPPIDEAPAI